MSIFGGGSSSEDAAAKETAMAVLTRKLAERKISQAEFECLVAAEERAFKLSGEMTNSPPPPLSDRLESLGLRVFSFKQHLENNKPFTMFYVECTNRGRPPWTVRRRYSEFHTFFTALKKQHRLDPTGISFPPKKLGKLTKEQIETRRSVLNSFLNELLDRRQTLSEGSAHALATFVEFEEHDTVNTAASASNRYMETLESIELG